MKLSPDALIVTVKLTKYLLVWRDADDKSKFLAQAGYGQENWQQLEADLRSQLLPLEAVPSDEPNQFGDVYEIRGGLRGVNGVNERGGYNLDGRIRNSANEVYYAISR